MTERKPSQIRKRDLLKGRLEAKKPTPSQISNYIDAQVSEDFEKLEPYYIPSKADIEQKQEFVKRKKRNE